MSGTATIDGIAIEQGSGNPYADLGHFRTDEMLVKAGLAHEIGEIIRTRHLTQQRAADLLGMPQPKLSETLRGKFRGISQAKMIGCSNRLGRDVDVVVKKAKRRTFGHTHVVMA
jgi:predicted XRE-type DNA-binding protein